MKKEKVFEPAFKGCVVVPVTDDDDDMERIKYYGDWYDRKRQYRIMKKPRKYFLVFYIKGYQGEKGVETIRIITRNNFSELTKYITEEGNNIINEIGKERVDLKASYVSIKA